MSTTLPTSPDIADNEHLDVAAVAVHGEAHVRGRRAAVVWQDGMLQGDPELMTRLVRVSGEFPRTASEFLRALRVVGGRSLLVDL